VDVVADAARSARILSFTERRNWRQVSATVTRYLLSFFASLGKSVSERAREREGGGAQSASFATVSFCRELISNFDETFETIASTNTRDYFAYSRAAL